ncbi:hypothetical protein ACJJIU_06750 [Microbulbifer sp. CnH-101-E]|uniref:hypothetical protein n=1 Tax=unclassified Microbulbifer TaxID=2619833 RepID=UPI0040391D15
MIKIICMISLLSILCGCSNQATMVIFSQPEGAYITEIDTEKPYGMTPVSVVYNPDALEGHIDSEGCYLVKGFRAQWVSGAISIVDPIKLCGSATGEYNISINRQSSHANLDKDLQFALQLQAIRAQQQQANAAQNSAIAALWSAWAQSQNNSVNCIVKPVGNSVHTNCN